ncbi:MAG: hypothetical protein OS130_11645 [Thermodesulfobacteriota bacterium]|nr:MAG: hypothetical protein OS130_11645 [Thermodesulfobacteriota bacterium]
MLLIGESAPVSGNFFYIKGAMTTYTARAFEKSYGIKFCDHSDFLNFFRKCGCYIDDLSLIPVNAMNPKEREQALKGGIKPLSQRILEIRPEIVVSVLRKIEPYVREAVKMTGLEMIFFVLPFPGNGHQNTYVDGLSNILRQFMPIKT